MKKILLTVLAAITFAGISFAQNINIGAKVGANFDKIDGESFKDGYNLGFHLGGWIKVDLTRSIGLQGELIFNQTNTTFADSLKDVEAAALSGSSKQLNYLTIPILLRINVTNLLTLNLGPQYGILMNSHQTLLENGENAFKNGDFAVVVGAQVNLGALNIYGRYNIGLSNISDLPTPESWKSQQIQIGLGYKIL